MKRLLIALTLWLCANVSSVQGAEESSSVKNILIVEGLFAFNAALAADDPRAYGTVCGLLLFPLAAMGGEGKYSMTSRWTTFIGAELIALYNVKMDNDGTSKNDVFKNNMIAWHALLGVGALTAWLFEDDEESLSLRTTDHRGIQLEYRVKF